MATNRNFEQLGLQRLENKKQRMRNLLKIAMPDEALYREIMLSLGYKNNKIPFLELATLLPYAEIRKLKERDIIEKALLYRAGLTEDRTDIPKDFDFSLRMTRDSWTYKGCRPANYPEVRIKQISPFLSETAEKGIFSYFRDRIKNSLTEDLTEKNVKSIVKEIISFGGPGESRKIDMFFNIILPFFLVIFEDEKKQGLLRFLDTIIELYPITVENKKIADKLIKGLMNENIILKTFIEFFGILEFKDRAAVGKSLTHPDRNGEYRDY